MRAGVLWRRTRAVSNATTRVAGGEKSTSIPSTSRFQSSTTFRVRKRRPSVSASLMKSNDQHSLGGVGTCKGRFTRSGRRFFFPPLARLQAQ